MRLCSIMAMVFMGNDYSQHLALYAGEWRFAHHGGCIEYKTVTHQAWIDGHYMNDMPYPSCTFQCCVKL